MTRVTDDFLSTAVLFMLIIDEWILERTSLSTAHVREEEANYRRSSLMIRTTLQTIACWYDLSCLLFWKKNTLRRLGAQTSSNAVVCERFNAAWSNPSHCSSSPSNMTKRCWLKVFLHRSPSPSPSRKRGRMLHRFNLLQNFVNRRTKSASNRW